LRRAFLTGILYLSGSGKTDYQKGGAFFMELRELPQTFAVCKLPGMPTAPLAGAFVFFARTDEEISLVCEAGCVPPDALAVAPDWRALKVAGPLDFALVGVLAKIAALLAEAGVSLFAVSTYDTDYVLVRADALARAVAALSEGGYTVTR
jgi:hypothetical protein